MKIAIITIILEADFENMKDEDLETTVKLYLKSEDIPLCQKVEHIKVLTY